ncbi:MAG: hypothetical protein M0Z42_16740 [Actinomycetota bacterium]|jgi:putative ABC transport system permease protein|nr:hypothetical protein [Actinomycetota bacterium]
MGKLLLVSHLAIPDVRHHLAQAVLILVAIAAATATLTMGLALHGVTSRPYQQTRAATKGPDVVAYTQSSAQAERLANAQGVTAHSGPYAMIYAVVRYRSITAGAEAEAEVRRRLRSINRN